MSDILFIFFVFFSYILMVDLCMCLYNKVIYGRWFL